MDRALYLSMAGAKNNMLEQAARSHNLANVSTVGFKADFANARSLPLNGGDGIQSRVYALAESFSVDLASGPQMQTGRELDIAIDGKGWIAVQTANGSEAYTRAGNLSVDSTGVLRTARGMPVLGSGGPIAIPDAEKIEIGTDGTISVRALGQGPATLVVIDRIKLVSAKAEELSKQPDGMLHSSSGSLALDANIRVRTGFLESSNVNAVAELTSVVSLARQFEMQVKMMQTIAENAEASSSILRIQV